MSPSFILGDVRPNGEVVVTLLSIAPDIVAGASQDLENLGSELRSAHAAAAAQTTAVVAPAADEISAAFTELLSTHAQGFQALSAQAAAFHDEFVKSLSGGAAQYVSTEAANAASSSAATIHIPGLPPINLPTLNLPGLPTLPSIGLPKIPLLTEDLGLTGGIKTPFGPLSFITGNGTATINSDFSLNAALTAGINGRPSLAVLVNGTPATPPSGSVFAETLTGGGTLRTPFGPLNVLSLTGNADVLSTGGLNSTIVARVPLAPPLTLTVHGTPTGTPGGVHENLSGTGTIKTPFGPLTVLTMNGTATVLPDGSLDSDITARVPLLPAFWFHVDGTPENPLGGLL
jgi:hypothetical protein